MHSIGSAEATICPFAIFNPTFRGEIRRLGDVEASVKATMVTAGKCYHELALTLDNFVVGYGVLTQKVGRNEAHFVS